VKNWSAKKLNSLPTSRSLLLSMGQTMGITSTGRARPGYQGNVLYHTQMKVMPFFSPKSANFKVTVVMGQTMGITSTGRARPGYQGNVLYHTQVKVMPFFSSWESWDKMWSSRTNHETLSHCTATDNTILSYSTMYFGLYAMHNDDDDNIKARNERYLQ
jgi:hypothetical protein